MQSEKAKLMSCFGNDYCIPTTLFKTISKLKYMFLILFKKNFGSCDLDFSKLPHLKKKVRYDPLCFIMDGMDSPCMMFQFFGGVSNCMHRPKYPWGKK